MPEIAPSVPSVTRTPAASMSGTRAMPLASFRFDTGLCDTVGAGPRQDRDLLVVEPDAMRQHRARVEQPEMVEMPDHRPAVARLDVGPLGAGLGGMGAEEPALLRRQPPGRAAGPPARPCRRRAESMPGSTSSAPANSAKNASASAGRSATRLARPRPRPSKKMPPVETRSPTARAAATVSRGCQNMSITVVTPPSSMLGEAERRPEPHRLAVQDRALGLPHRLQPRLQRQVLDQPAEQAVGRHGNGC